MKYVKIMFLGALVFGLVFSLSSAAFAKDKEGAEVKILQDAAMALQQSNPVLASGLADFANEEAQEMSEGKTNAKAKESAEWKEKHEAHARLLKDAATALTRSNPDLAKKLQNMHEGKNDKKMHEMNAEKNEKEEPGEKTEPMSEKNEKK